jgi:exo-beta-1,3-glucanase (GH17 family)
MHAPTPKPATRFLLLLLCIALAAGLTILAWWLPNRPVQVGHDPAGPKVGMIESLSFAPFRRGQGPLNKVYPSAAQVEEDLASLRGITRGVRTYTAREGLEIVPAKAGQYGLQVMQGIWLGREPDINAAEVEAGIKLANQYPDTIKSVIVGNEVLLRKDLTVDQLIAQIRKVKAAVKQPVTYADVWEFWLRFPQLLDEVDFVTVHFLPYWEDMPISVAHSMPHIMDVYRTVQTRLPGKPVVIGEVGWPSQGRSRREAIPSPIEAAGFITDFLQLAEREKLSYNLVEAFDQPWKERLEGTVGAAWGVLDEVRQPKYEIGGKVSNLPQWPLFAGLSLLLALILMVVRAQQLAALPPRAMVTAVLFAQGLGILLGATIEHGLEYNYSPRHLIEFAVLAAIQGVFAALLFAELLDRLAGRDPGVSPLRPLGTSLADLRRFAPLYVGIGRARADAATLASHAALQRARLAEWIYGLLALWAVYHGVMQVVAGRYRDFPIDYFLLPIAGFIMLRLLSGGRERGLASFALAVGFTRPATAAVAGLRLGWEAMLVFLLLSLPVLVLLIETLHNREAIYWCVIMALYALPLLGNLLMARAVTGTEAAARGGAADKAIAQSSPSR